MKIKCQEHYEKVAEYAKSIGDTTFQNCIERLSNGRRTPTAGTKSNCIGILHRIHSDSRKGRRTGGTVS